jgi:hypothetical protein
MVGTPPVKQIKCLESRSSQLSIRSISSRSLSVLNAAKYRHIPVIGNFIIIKTPAKPSDNLLSQDDQIQVDYDDSLSEDSISLDENDEVLKSHSTVSAKIVNHDFKNEFTKPKIAMQVKMNFNINNSDNKKK